MFFYRKTPSYCIWEETETKIFTISYRYIHCLDNQGNMYCLQKSTPSKRLGIENFKLLDSSHNLPNLIHYENLEINNIPFMYTYFSSQQGLGYPPAYMLFNMMEKNKHPIKDYIEYIKTLVDAHCNLVSQSVTKGLPTYKTHRVLTNHYVNQNLYFKDSMFFETEECLDIDRLAHFWHSSIDGFRRAQGIVDAYRKRQDSTLKGEKQLFAAINECSEYARKKCLSLKNVKAK